MEIVMVSIGCILVLETILAWIKAIANDNDYDPDYYKYCKSCERGFCTENPKTEDCIRWKSEQSHT